MLSERSTSSSHSWRTREIPTPGVRGVGLYVPCAVGCLSSCSWVYGQWNGWRQNASQCCSAREPLPARVEGCAVLLPCNPARSHTHNSQQGNRSRDVVRVESRRGVFSKPSGSESWRRSRSAGFRVAGRLARESGGGGHGRNARQADCDGDCAKVGLGELNYRWCEGVGDQ